MSDADSQTSPCESFYSPLRSDSPFRSDDPDPPPDESSAKSPSKGIVAFGKYCSPRRNANYQQQQKQKAEVFTMQPSGAAAESPVVLYKPPVKEEAATGMTKVGRMGGHEVVFGVGGKEDLEDASGGEMPSGTAMPKFTSPSRTGVKVKRAELGFRVLEVILCLISFSVMAADKNQGWSVDSFDRYKEYRYCVAVSAIGFVYATFQAYDVAYHLITDKHVISRHLRYHFDFSMDQILAYLLISASSSAVTRVDDWVSNWGKDKFAEMATMSTGVSFLAFATFALSSLVSGYNLCRRSTS